MVGVAVKPAITHGLDTAAPEVFGASMHMIGTRTASLLLFRRIATDLAPSWIPLGIGCWITLWGSSRLDRLLRREFPHA